MKERCQIIAEIGSVHDGKMELAEQLIDAAADAGVDWIKFQTHFADTESLPDAPNPPYFTAEKRVDYFKRTGFSSTQWQQLKAMVESKGLGFLSSPFSIEAARFLDDMGVAAFKIPSGEVTNIPMLEFIASRGKTVFLSTGMSAWDEIDAAFAILNKGGTTLYILQCTSEYPCSFDHVGLNVMEEMKSRYHVPIGFSDHTLGMEAALAAVALGSQVIEKHITLSQDMYGSDAKNSMEAKDFKLMVKTIRNIETVLKGEVDKNEMARNLAEMKYIFEKSIVTTADIDKGMDFTEFNTGVKKPGGGLPPKDLRRVLSSRASHDLKRNKTLHEEDLSS